MIAKLLDRGTCAKIRAQALVSLYGTKTCDVRNMKRSCFASEMCSYHTPHQDIDVLMRAKYPIVVLDGERFCACIAAHPMNYAPGFLNVELERGSLFIYTLCVDDGYRQMSIAHELINVIKATNRAIYLTVARGKDIEYEDFFTHRSSKLLKYYENHGFRICATNAEFYLMCFNCNSKPVRDPCLENFMSI
jgi:GNAT superfamily N-acetyltransferase